MRNRRSCECSYERDDVRQRSEQNGKSALEVHVLNALSMISSLHRSRKARYALSLQS